MNHSDSLPYCVEVQDFLEYQLVLGFPTSHHICATKFTFQQSQDKQIQLFAQTHLGAIVSLLPWLSHDAIKALQHWMKI